MINKNKFSIADELCLVDGIPLFSVVDLNITPSCSRTCSFCPRGHGWRDPGKAISVENIKKITAELRELDFKGVVHVAGFGEPLLHRQHYEVMEALSEGDWWTCINTNGDFLKDKKQVELYDKVLISMYDGPHQIETYSKILDGLNFELLERYNNDFTELSNRAGYLEDNRVRNIDKKCTYPMYDLFINNNGDVLTCCHNWDLSMSLGNIFEESIWKVWVGEKLKRYRTILMKNRKIAPCNKCDVTGTLVGNKHMSSWKEHYERKA